MTYRLTFGRYTRVNGLLGAGHFLSHFYQLCLPPLFIAWQKVFDVSFAELGVAMAVLSVVAAVMQTPMGFIVDRYGARPLLIARHSDDEPGDFGHGGCDLLLANCRAGAVVGVGNSVFHPCDYAILSGSVARERLGRSFAFHTFTG